MAVHRLDASRARCRESTLVGRGVAAPADSIGYRELAAVGEPKVDDPLSGVALGGSAAVQSVPCESVKAMSSEVCGYNSSEISRESCGLGG